jgi:hypothetical protein
VSVTTTDQLLAAFEPWMTDDLATYLTTVGEMFAEAELLVHYDAGRLEVMGIDPEDLDPDESYHSLLDVDLTPAQALPYLAQFIGERFAVGIDETAQRGWIRDHPNARRGTLNSIASAAQRYLTGGKLVTIVERNDGTSATDAPDDVNIIVYADECPNQSLVIQALQDTFPLELSLHFQVVTATTWQQIRLSNDLKPDGTWGFVMSGKVGGIYYPG